jgi:hypothetical protein
MDHRTRQENRDFAGAVFYIALFFGALFIAGVLLAVA